MINVSFGYSSYLFTSGPSPNHCNSFFMLFIHSALLLCYFCLYFLLQNRFISFESCYSFLVVLSSLSYSWILFCYFRRPCFTCMNWLYHEIFWITSILQLFFYLFFSFVLLVLSDFVFCCFVCLFFPISDFTVCFPSASTCGQQERKSLFFSRFPAFSFCWLSSGLVIRLKLDYPFASQIFKKSCVSLSKTGSGLCI